MDPIAPIKVDGLKQFQRNLKTLSPELAKTLRKTLNVIADDVVQLATPHIPRRSGRAAGSLRAASTQTGSRVRGGSARAPYYPWLEFGGAIGRRDHTIRKHEKGGRYLFPALARERPRIEQKLNALLEEIADEVTSG